MTHLANSTREFVHERLKAVEHVGKVLRLDRDPDRFAAALKRKVEECLLASALVHNRTADGDLPSIDDKVIFFHLPVSFRLMISPDSLADGEALSMAPA